MRKFTVELDDVVCKWLEHLSEITGEPIEKLIAGGVYQQVAALEDSIYKSFSVHE